MNMFAPLTLSRHAGDTETMISAKQSVVVLVSDDLDTINQLTPVCDFLDLHLEVVSAGGDLADTLAGYRPMAVVSAIEGIEQDGFHTMRVVAKHDRNLPMLMLTEGDPVMMGAVDAMQDLCGLTAVTPTSEFALAGQLVAFLFNAGRQAGCLRLVSV